MIVDATSRYHRAGFKKKTPMKTTTPTTRTIRAKSDGKNEEAIAKLIEALEKDESFVRAHLALSVLYHKLADYEKSVAHAERAVELEPNDAFNVAALSVTYQRAFEGTRDPIYIQKAEEGAE